MKFLLKERHSCLKIEHGYNTKVFQNKKTRLSRKNILLNIVCFKW